MLPNQQINSLREKNSILGVMLSHGEEESIKSDKKAEMNPHSFSSNKILMCRVLSSLKSDAGEDIIRVLASIN